MNAPSLRARLTLWYTGALLVVLLLFGVQVLWQQERIGLRRVDGELADFATTMVSVLRDEIREKTPKPAQEALDTIGVHDRAAAILDGDRRPLAASWHGLELQSMPEGDSDRVWTAKTRSGDWRVFSHRERIEGATFTFVTGRPLADVLRERREAMEAMAVAIPVAVVLAALGGLWLAAIGLAPITAMASRAAVIAPGGIDDLGQSNRTDELGQLARAFNGLVARLRSALQTQRQFMTDASHELRTPVSVIRSAADITLRRDGRTEAEYREALSIVDQQARRVSRLVDDMLVLARADTGGYPLRRSHLYVDDLVNECTRTVALLASERGVSVTSSPPTECALDGDEDLLRRMLLNVVQNAVQHTAAGKRVAVNVVPNGRYVAIDITNEGRPIPAADRERIFDRFVQLDASRRSSGSGLGLPIARWIAEAHGGSLFVKESGERGTTFTVSLPLSS